MLKDIPSAEDQGEQEAEFNYSYHSLKGQPWN